MLLQFSVQNYLSIETKQEVSFIASSLKDDQSCLLSDSAMQNDRVLPVIVLYGANSNPCFELWLILHEQDFNKPDGREALYKLLKKLRPEYDPDSKTLDFDDIVRKVIEAEKHAEKGLKRRIEEGANPLGRPYTLVFKLTAAIREAAATST